MINRFSPENEILSEPNFSSKRKNDWSILIEDIDILHFRLIATAVLKLEMRVATHKRLSIDFQDFYYLSLASLGTSFVAQWKNLSRHRKIPKMRGEVFNK